LSRAYTNSLAKCKNKKNRYTRGQRRPWCVYRGDILRVIIGRRRRTICDDIILASRPLHHANPILVSVVYGRRVVVGAIKTVLYHRGAFFFVHALGTPETSADTNGRTGKGETDLFSARRVTGRSLQ